MNTSLPFRSLQLALALVFLPLATHAQSGKFTVNGRVKIEGGDIAGTRMVVYRDGVKEKTVSSNLSKFGLDLALNANYILSFEKDGFVTKKLQFDTRLPEGTATKDFAAFEFSVSLFKQYDDVNIVVFNQPVGIIRYEPDQEDFDYDTDYTKSIQSQLQRTLAEVEQKQKEEAREASAEAKRQAAEAKAQAKMEAQARKRAEAEAKAEQPSVEVTQREEEKKAPPPAVADPPPVAAPRRRPDPPPPAVQGIMAVPVMGEDVRRYSLPVTMEEHSPVAMAVPVRWEDFPEYPESVPELFRREEELVVEPTRVVTVVRIERDGVRTEYRRVSHKWGDTFYFKNGLNCPKQVYEMEALGGRSSEGHLVDVLPRKKMD